MKRMKASIQQAEKDEATNYGKGDQERVSSMKLAQKRLELELQAKTTTTQNAAEKAGKEKAATAMKVAHAEHMLKKQQQSAKHAEKQAALASKAVVTAQEKLAEKNVLELQEKLKAAELAIAEAKRVKSDP